MSDEKNTRAAIDRVASRMRNEAQKQGRTITHETARGKAREIAVNYRRNQQQ